MQHGDGPMGAREAHRAQHMMLYAGAAPHQLGLELLQWSTCLYIEGVLSMQLSFDAATAAFVPAACAVFCRCWPVPLCRPGVAGHWLLSVPPDHHHLMQHGAVSCCLLPLLPVLVCRPGVAGHRLFPIVSDHHHLLQQADVPQAPCSGGDCELIPTSGADGNDSHVSQPMPRLCSSAMYEFSAVQHSPTHYSTVRPSTAAV